MQLGILGLPKSGKTTLFNTLTASHQATDKFATSGQTNVGVATVPRPRLEQLRDLFKPKRYVPATVQYVDIPGMKQGESAESLDLDQAARRWTPWSTWCAPSTTPRSSIPEGSVDPARDVANVDLELILADHDLVERRLDRLEKATKRGLNPEEQREQAAPRRIVLPALEAEKPLREVELEPDDERRLRGFQLLSAKPMLIVINVDEGRARRRDAGGLRGRAAAGGARRSWSARPIEQEISAPAARGAEGVPGRPRPLRAEPRPGDPGELRPPGADLVLHRRRGRGAGLDDPPRHPGPRGRRRHPLRHRARLHPRRGGPLGRPAAPEDHGRLPRSRRCSGWRGRSTWCRTGTWCTSGSTSDRTDEGPGRGVGGPLRSTGARLRALGG